MNTFSEHLLQWFDLHGRKDLPWQEAISHYRVWVSEIMLQQTQVKTAIPYFNRFMLSFPTVEALAKAPISEILEHWSGLGYYARARNLHKAAQKVMSEFNGQFPNTLETLSSLPGIGRSTASAILSIVDNQPLAILDGNVKRVLTRYYAISGFTGNKTIEQQLWKLAQKLTPQDRANHYTQAIMDLGATLCTRARPRCVDCPVKINCKAYLEGNPSSYPSPKPKKAEVNKSAHFLMLMHQNEILFEKRPDKGIWGGLLALPYFDSWDEAHTWLNHHFIETNQKISWPKRKHVFTHFTLHFTPIEVKVGQNKITPSESHHWHALENYHKLGLPAPVKKLLQDYYQVKYGQNDLLS